VVAWLGFDNYIDPHLARGQLIMVDTGVSFEGPLFSKYPRQWVIPSDQDFQSLSENFSGQFQWLLITPSTKPDAQTPEMEQALASTDGGRWKTAKDFGAVVGELYQWVPTRGYEQGRASGT
jgi:hypothetical protein